MARSRRQPESVARTIDCRRHKDGNGGGGRKIDRGGQARPRPRSVPSSSDEARLSRRVKVEDSNFQINSALSDSSDGQTTAASQPTNAGQEALLPSEALLQRQLASFVADIALPAANQFAFVEMAQPT